MAITFIRTGSLGSGSSVTSQQTGALGVQPTIGDFMIAWAWGFNITTDSNPPAFSDTGGNTYTIPSGAYQFLANGLWCAIGYAPVTTAGASFKVTVTKASTWTAGSMCVVASEFRQASASQDGSAVGTTGVAAQSFAPGNMTVKAGDLVVAVMTNRDTSAGSNLTDPTGFTVPGEQTNGATFEVGSAAYAINPGSPTNPTWTTTDLGVVWAAAQFALLKTPTLSQIDTPTPAEVVTPSLSLGIPQASGGALADTPTPTEAVTIAFSGWDVTASDSATPADVGTVYVTLSIPRQADSATPAEVQTVQLSYAPAVTDTPTPAETVVVFISIGPVGTDSPTPADVATVSLALPALGTDTPTPADVGTVYVTLAIPSQSDATTPSEAATVSLPMGAVGTDSTTPADLGIVYVTLSLRLLTDTVTPTDAVTVALSAKPVTALLPGPVIFLPDPGTYAAPRDPDTFILPDSGIAFAVRDPGVTVRPADPGVYFTLADPR